MFFKMKGDVEITMYRVGVAVERRVAKDVPVIPWNNTKGNFMINYKLVSVEKKMVPSICATTKPGSRSFTKHFVIVDSMGCISCESFVGVRIFSLEPMLTCIHYDRVIC